MTGNYKIIVPIILTSIIGTVVATKFKHDSIDTVDFTREGIDIHEGREAAIMNGYPHWKGDHRRCCFHFRMSKH